MPTICNNAVYGIRLCDGSAFEEARIDLSSIASELSGTLPSELAAHSSVRRMFLTNSRLDGRISGTVPFAFGRLSSMLERLELAGHDLSGTIPPQLTLLTKLSHLSMYENRGLSGTIPAALVGVVPRLNRSLMREVKLQNTLLSGTLPAQLTPLSDLFWARYTRLSGTMPTSLPGRRDFDVSETLISGTLADALGNGMNALRSLIAYNCRLSGSVPAAAIANITAPIAYSTIVSVSPGITRTGLTVGARTCHCTSARFSLWRYVACALCVVQVSRSGRPGRGYAPCSSTATGCPACSRTRTSRAGRQCPSCASSTIASLAPSRRSSAC